jgi:hypothetical protein
MIGYESSRFWYRHQDDAQKFFSFVAGLGYNAMIYPAPNPGPVFALGEPGFIVGVGK